jgi:hypothetical protein
METIEEDFMNPAPSRPVFLKVLCMLTFIGSGYGIVNSAITWFNANSIHKIMVEKKQEILDDVNRKKQKDKESVNFAKMIMTDVYNITTPENLRRSAMSNAVSAIICLLGAILMWNLKRAGFYLYTLGTIIGIFLPFYLLGSNLIINLQAGFLSFIGILFVIFYAMNLKSMK